MLGGGISHLNRLKGVGGGKKIEKIERYRRGEEGAALEDGRVYISFLPLKNSSGVPKKAAGYHLGGSERKEEKPPLPRKRSEAALEDSPFPSSFFLFFFPFLILKRASVASFLKEPLLRRRYLFLHLSLSFPFLPSKKNNKKIWAVPSSSPPSYRLETSLRSAEFSSQQSFLPTPFNNSRRTQ